MKLALASAALFAAAAIVWHPVHAQPKPVVQPPAAQQQRPTGPLGRIFQLPRAQAQVAAGAARRLTCLISPTTNRVYIDLDYGDPSAYGMRVTTPGQQGEYWIWLPTRLAVHMNFAKSLKPAYALGPGQCAFDDQGTATGPDEIVFPRERDQWDYRPVDGHPVLVPMGSRVEDLLTANRKVVFEVTLTEYPPKTGKQVWYAKDAPQPAD